MKSNYKNQPNQNNIYNMADEKYVALKYEEMRKFINFIERTCCVELIGDKVDLESGRPYLDCVGKMTIAQTNDFFLNWKQKISKSYEGQLKKQNIHFKVFTR